MIDYSHYEKKLVEIELRGYILRLRAIEMRGRELRGNPYHDPINGRFTSGGIYGYIRKRFSNGGVNPIDKPENGGIIKSSDEVSALGENKFTRGFSEHNLDEHWGGSHDHSPEYPNFTKAQYAQRALVLVQSKADGKKILGYINSKSEIVRYDRSANDFVKGNPKIGIKTMFKPQSGEKYFERNRAKEEVKP